MRFNQIAIAGRLGKDPELKYAPNGTAICKMRIAYDQGSGDKKSTGWIEVTAFQKVAENAAKYLKKGSAVLVGGRLEYREWDDNGSKRSMVSIAAHDLQFLDPANKNGGAPAQEEPPPGW